MDHTAAPGEQGEKGNDMTENTYSTSQAAADAAEYATACALLVSDPEDADALATRVALDAKYGEGFFEG